MKIEFEIFILTVASMVSYMISTVKIGISNIIKSQTLSSSCSGSFFSIPIYLFEINNFLNLLVSLVFYVHCWTVTPAYKYMNDYPLFIVTIRVISLSGSILFLFRVALICLSSGLFTHISITLQASLVL